MFFKLTPALLTSIALAASAVAPSSHRAALCSKHAFVPFQSENEAHFIGTPAQDTVLAGAGDVKYDVAPGHSGGAVSRPIYGQLVSVERIAGLAAPRVGAAKHVILVPWDYGADCSPTIWPRSARWLPADERGFYVGTLRDSMHWVNGTPTFDVFTPEVWPYPQQAMRMMRRALVQPSFMLDVDQVFSFTSLLPDFKLLEMSDAAAQPLFDWARANPELARRYPADDALHTLRYDVMNARLRRVKPPIAGTYEFSFSLGDGGQRRLYARTRSRPTSSFTLLEQPPPADRTTVPVPDGYYLLATIALSPDSLPRTCMRNRETSKESYLLLLDQKNDSSANEWQGKVGPELVLAAFPKDTALHTFARADFERFSRQRSAKVPAETPARFTRDRGGALTVEERIVHDDGRTFTLRGKRLSTVTEACDW